MKKLITNNINSLTLVFLLLTFSGAVESVMSQEIKWLRVAELQSFINELGAEFESEGTTGNTNFFSWLLNIVSIRIQSG